MLNLQLSNQPYLYGCYAIFALVVILRVDVVPQKNIKVDEGIRELFSANVQ